MILSILTSIFNIISVYYASKNNRLTWLFGIFAAILTIIIMYNSEFIWQVYFQIITIIFSYYAFVTWKSSEEDNDNDVHISNPLTTFIVMFGVIPIISSYVFTNVDNVDIDGMLSLQCLFATYLLYKKNCLAWAYWITIDITFITYGLINDNIEFFIVYLILFILAVRGLFINFDITLKNKANNVDKDYILDFLIKK